MKMTKVVMAGFALGVSFSSLWADLNDIPKEGLYFTNGKFTVIELEKYPDFLFARNGLKKLNLKIEKIRKEVFIIPHNGPQIPLHADGFEILHLDKLKTGVDSRVILMINPTMQLVLGEKTIVQFRQNLNKFFFTIEAGNARLLATEITLENKYFLETSEFVSDISSGDFFVSASKMEGSSIFCVTGSLIK